MLKAQYKLEMQKGETEQLRGELFAIRKLEELELLEWVTSADQLAGMSVVGLREMRARLEKHAAALAEAIPRCVCRLSDPLACLSHFVCCWLERRWLRRTTEAEAQAQQRVLALVDKVGMPTAEAPPSGEGEGEDE